MNFVRSNHSWRARGSGEPLSAQSDQNAAHRTSNNLRRHTSIVGLNRYRNGADEMPRSIGPHSPGETKIASRAIEEVQKEKREKQNEHWINWRVVERGENCFPALLEAWKFVRSVNHRPLQEIVGRFRPMLAPRVRASLHG